ncbi:uncharacterized protein EI90DRAFT_3030105 [Cantharellus anzutake]|uniref:uncharacterized protein n=1 Tax=Cantharellus anzutake TaxID=1750568 RepID=UPI001903868F|nr:uncharacterized protein EI90DRAFT_3030105 [Cantharellus anzutake]KAF8342758.1 hypothetical protein EI90DRAFT_3030105 [Cantharellus anzutake]
MYRASWGQLLAFNSKPQRLITDANLFSSKGVIGLGNGVRSSSSSATSTTPKHSKPKLLPAAEEMTRFPDLTKPDPILDTKVVSHVSPTVKHPYSATIIHHTPRFGSSIEPFPSTSVEQSITKSEDGDSSKSIEEGWEKENIRGRKRRSKQDGDHKIDAQRQEIANARMLYPKQFLQKLHRYPLIVKRVVQQTPKGRQASFFALVVVGNGDGVMGVGQGKDSENIGAAQTKAYADAFKSLDTVERFENRTIFTEIHHKLGATQVTMWPRPAGFGLAVNPYIHRICKAAGIRDLSAKVIGSRNPMQVVKTTMMMLQGGSAPLGFGDGVGGKITRLEAKEGIRPKEVVERERGRKLIEGSGWL